MNGILLAIFATAALAVVIFLVLLYLEFSSVPRDEREFMDPLPGLLQRLRQGMSLLGYPPGVQDRHIKSVSDTLADVIAQTCDEIPPVD